MAKLAALLVLAHTTGWASAYAEGVMNSTIRTRQNGATAHDLPYKLPVVAGFAAVQDCDRIGDTFYLRPNGSPYWERFLATDCGGSTDGGALWMRTNNILVEVDWATWRRWRPFNGRVEMTWEPLWDPHLFTLIN